MWTREGWVESQICPWLCFSHLHVSCICRLCLLKEPLLCSCCWTAMHLEMLMVSLTTLLSSMWHGHLHVLAISLKIASLCTLIQYNTLVILLVSFEYVCHCHNLFDELPEKCSIATIMIFISVTKNEIIHLFCLTSETHHDQYQIEIWSNWPPLKGKPHMIFLSLLGRGFLMNTRFQFNDVLWIEIKTREKKLCHIKDSWVVSCC